MRIETTPSTRRKRGVAEAHVHNDVVDGDVDQLDKVAEEAHEGKASRRGEGNLAELCKDREG